MFRFVSMTMRHFCCSEGDARSGCYLLRLVGCLPARWPVGSWSSRRLHSSPPSSLASRISPSRSRSPSRCFRWTCTTAGCCGMQRRAASWRNVLGLLLLLLRLAQSRIEPGSAEVASDTSVELRREADSCECCGKNGNVNKKL